MRIKDGACGGVGHAILPGGENLKTKGVSGGKEINKRAFVCRGNTAQRRFAVFEAITDPEPSTAETAGTGKTETL